MAPNLIFNYCNIVKFIYISHFIYILTAVACFFQGRIKKIMQTDEEVGKVAQAVPVIIYILFHGFNYFGLCFQSCLHFTTGSIQKFSYS